MALISPGVQISVIDETRGASIPVGTIPLVFIATRKNKKISPTIDSSLAFEVAEGTLTENANSLYLITSQTELLRTFGSPVYANDSIASELNEYGLLAAYQFLGISGRCWVLRANVPLDELEPTSVEPTNTVPNGTYWFDTQETSWGIFKNNGSSSITTAWDNKEPIVIDSKTNSENVIIGDVGFNDNTTALGLSGTLEINGTNVSVSATDSLEDIKNNINSASITDIKATIVRYKSLSWLVIRNTATEDITIGGTSSVTSGLGFSSPVEITYPRLTVGTAGDFAVVTINNDNLYFEKIRPTDKFGESDPDSVNFWFLVGSSTWKIATPTITTGVTTTEYTSSPIISGDSLILSDGTVSITITFGAADVGTLTDVVNKINTEISGAGYDSKFGAIINSLNRIVLSNFDGENLEVSNGAGNSGDVLQSLGISSVDGNKLFYEPHYNVPSGVSGDVWIKTTEPNSGADYVIKQWDEDNETWLLKDAPFFINDDDVLASLGTSIPSGSLYVQYNLYGDALDPIASHVIRKYNGFSEVVALSDEQPGVSTPALVPGDQFVIVAGRTDGNKDVAVITVPSTDIEDLASVINNTSSLSNVQADIEGGFLKIINTAGFSLSITYTDPITLTDYSTTNSGTPIESLGFVDGSIFSNWENLVYVASANEPKADPVEGQLWFNDDLKADIMVGDGNQWWGYRNFYPNTDPKGVIISGSKPTSQSDGTPLVENDIWLDSSDLENYPKLYRYRSATQKWELIDNTDQTTPLGIVFADARYTNNGKPDGSTLQEDLVKSDFVDPDAPDPRLYPSGILLFNTRASTFNVKQWNPDYFSDIVGTEVSPGVQYNVGSVSFPTDTITNENKGRWVSVSGLKEDGSPFMGRHAQREMVIKALQEAINSNQEIRSENVFFNLLACPGYPEVLEELVNLNVETKEVAFIVADTPARLSPDGTNINNWAKNSNNASRTGDEGLTTSYSYAGLYYPWALTTNIDGNEVLLPPSAIALRTIAYNDLIAQPWFAPAGFARGIVTNASSVGYISDEEEYVPLILNQGQRDVLYENKINPIAFIPGRGLVIFGQKTLHNVAGQALEEINVARLVNFLRYNFDIMAKPFLFEPNDKNTRDQVKSSFERFLGNIVGLRGLQDFAVICDESNNTPERIDRNELWIDVFIIPTRAIEFIYIPVRIRSTGEDLTNLLPPVPSG